MSSIAHNHEAAVETSCCVVRRNATLKNPFDLVGIKVFLLKRSYYNCFEIYFYLSIMPFVFFSVEALFDKYVRVDKFFVVTFLFTKIESSSKRERQCADWFRVHDEGLRKVYPKGAPYVL